MLQRPNIYQISFRAIESLDLQRSLVQSKGKEMIDCITGMIKDSLKIIQDKNSQIIDIVRNNYFDLDVERRINDLGNQVIGTNFKESIMGMFWGDELSYINKGMKEIKDQLLKQEKSLEILCISKDSERLKGKIKQNLKYHYKP